MKKILFLVLMLSATFRGFSETIVNDNGVVMTISIISMTDRTAQIGNGTSAAISTRTSGALTIPSSVKLNGITFRITSIAASAFINCDKLTSVEIPSNITTCGTDAFRYCTSLTSVGLPISLKRIGDKAFYGCTSLKEIELPQNLRGIDELPCIGDSAFMGCENLRIVTSNVYSPTKLGTKSFASIATDCELRIPIGKLSAYKSAGWTKEVFGKGVIEIGDVEENYCLENPVTAEFINNVVYPDDDYSFTLITDYCTQTTSYKQDLPQAVIMESPIVYDGETLVMETYSDETLVRTDSFLVGQRVLKIWNLTPKTRYTYKLFVCDADGTKNEISSGDFRTEGQVRMLNIPEMRNFRDIGGWRLPSGKHVKYGRLYRSAELETTKLLIKPEGVNELLRVLKIDVEMDFSDFAGSPIEQDVEYFSGDDYAIMLYFRGLQTTGEQYKNCFETIVNSLRENKNVLFHCSEGADRTGTMAFLLEGLLGVSESDLAKEYELTSLYLDKKYSENKRYRCATGYSGMINYVKNLFSGNTINEKIEQLALSLGITQEDINDYKRLMTLDDNRLHSIDLQCLSGTKIVLPISLTNDNEVKQCQFDLSLPDGVTVATKSNGKLDVKLTERAENFNISKMLLSNGDYRFVISSLDDDSFAGDSGVLMEITLDVSVAMESGEHIVKVLNTELSLEDDNDGVVVRPADTESKLTVKAYTPGDVNNNGAVSVTDVGCAINYILGQEPSVFIFVAADMNGDENVTVTDVGMIINQILNGGAASRPTMGMETADDKGDSLGGSVSANDILRVQDVEVAPGENVTLSIDLDNKSTNLMGWQCDIVLPEGLSIALDANGKPAATLGSRFSTTGHSISANRMINGAYRFICTSMDGEAIPGTTGALFTVTLQADASLAKRAGTGSAPTLTGTVTNIEFNTQDNQGLPFADVFFSVSIPGGGGEKCATPTIAYDKGELVFSCDTEGVTFISEVKVSDAKTSEGERVKLASKYTVNVYATKNGYCDSNVASATIQWRDGRPLFSGFSNVTTDGNALCDVNGDGKVDIADITTIISRMTAQEDK